MSARIVGKFKPTRGFAHASHIFLSALIPLLVLIFVRSHFVQLAVAIILITKWRIFTVRPRFWPAIIRANAVDVIVGLSTVVFMVHSHSGSIQLLWAVLYAVWQIVLKPGRSLFKVSLQALVGQTYGLIALFLGWQTAPILVLVLGAWVITYLAARHFFTSFEEPYTPLYSYTWGYFGAALTWISVHWLLFYGVIAQPALLLTVISFGLASLYYLQETDRLSKLYRREIIFAMVMVILVVLVLSEWGSKTI
jgi:hypothetical protein